MENIDTPNSKTYNTQREALVFIVVIALFKFVFLTDGFKYNLHLGG